MHPPRALGISAEAEAIYLEPMARGALSTEELAEYRGSGGRAGGDRPG